MRKIDATVGPLLAVYAHPDDADVAAGGLLAVAATAGTEVHIIVICRGDKGHPLDGAGAQNLAPVRFEELQTAGEILGATSVTNLGRLDGEVTNDEELRRELVGEIRRIRPHTVVGPDPTATFFGSVYVNHRDHREAGWALLDAVAPAAAMAGYFPDQGPPHHVHRLLLSGTLEPDVVVDITPAMDVKISAVLAHRSQMGDDIASVREVVAQRAELAGRSVGVRFGEVFRCVEFPA